MNKVLYLIFLVFFSGSLCAELTSNPESFEGSGSVPVGWGTWGSGSGTVGWVGVNDTGHANVVSGGAYSGSNYLQMGVRSDLWWGYMLAYSHNNPVIQGRDYDLCVH